MPDRTLAPLGRRLCNVVDNREAGGELVDLRFTHNRFDGLFFGVFLAWAWREFPDRIRELTKHRWLIFPIALALVSLSDQVRLARHTISLTSQLESR